MKTITHISASHALSLDSCMLKEAWNNEKKQKKLPLHPAAWLGIVSHSVLEETVKGEISDKASFDNVWAHKLALIEEEMKQSYPDVHLVPLSESYRFYEVRKIMTWKLIRGIRHVPSSLIATHSVGFEKWLQSRDRKIIGRADLISTSPDGVEIEDYKTGKINDELGNIKEVYKLQMQAYAALYHDITSIWPTKLTLIGLDGSKHPIGFSEGECEELLIKMKDSLDRVNEKILSGATEQDIAKPSPAECGFCQYRVDCAKYWKTRVDSDDWPRDLKGKVVEWSVSKSGYLRVIINMHGNRKVVRGLSRRHGLHGSELRELVLCNLTNDLIADHFVENYMTMCYQI